MSRNLSLYNDYDPKRVHWHTSGIDDLLMCLPISRMNAYKVMYPNPTITRLTND